MKAVYADPTLGYSTQTSFNIPPDFYPCGDVATVPLHEPLDSLVEEVLEEGY